MITGSSRGIGRGIAELFLARGYRVAGCSRGESDLSAADYHHACLDITDPEAVRSWVRRIKDDLGRIHVLVCNAGLVPAPSLLTMTPVDVLDATLRTNVGGTFSVCREVAKQMMRQRAGRIVTVSSMSAGLHEEGTAAYSASKSAIVEMTKILAKELAPAGITCNVVAPSVVDTDAVEALGPEIRARALGKLSIQREVTVQEVFNVIEFLVADASSSITGQVIHMGLVI